VDGHTLVYPKGHISTESNQRNVRDFHRIDGRHKVFITFPNSKGWRREAKKEKGRRDVG